MYADYAYYVSQYDGKMPEDAYPAAERRAEAYIRYLTHLNGDIFALDHDMVRDAVCAVADIYYADAVQRAAQAAEGRQGAVKSESNDGYSVTYVVEQQDGETADAALRRKAYDAAYLYLLPTGWMSRRVRCGHDHEYEYHGL